MGFHRQGPDLERLAADELAAELDGVEIGSPLELGETSKLALILERFVPQVLAKGHPGWQWEGIDGFGFARTLKTSERGAELVGTCILISDQTVTPVALELAVTGDGALRPIRIRLGEPGGGTLGISGPKCASNAASYLRFTLVHRLDSVAWVYDVTLED